MIKFRFVFKKAPEQFFFPFGERKQRGIGIENLFQVDYDTGLKRRRKYSGHDGKSKIAVQSLPLLSAKERKSTEKVASGLSVQHLLYFNSLQRPVRRAR